MQKQRSKKEEKWKVKSSWMKGEDFAEDATDSSALPANRDDTESAQVDPLEAGDLQESSMWQSRFVTAGDDEGIETCTSLGPSLRRKPL